MVAAAIESNWVAPVGPDLDAFESDIAAVAGRRYAVGLSSGTAALHLALKEVGVGVDDEVLVSSFTFAAPANAVSYLGARPVFIDSDTATWNMSPALVAEELADRKRTRRLPKAAVIVDLYGQCAEYRSLLPLFDEHGIPVIEDAAEALGASYDGTPAGGFGKAAVYSFNGNKIITTGGGGMLVTDDDRLASRVRYLAAQARENVPHYEHVEVGFNYRLSNLLAAFGRAQLSDLERRVARRREINRRYRSTLDPIPGVSFMPEGQESHSTFWLTCMIIDPIVAGKTRDDIRRLLETHSIEARPAWKPMHLQPVYAGAARRVDGTSERLFNIGLCLPSGSSLTDAELDHILEVLLMEFEL